MQHYKYIIEKGTGGEEKKITYPHISSLLNKPNDGNKVNVKN